MESPDQIFAARVIDTCLATDGRVDLCQQRGWDLHETDTALIAGGCETGHVTDHTTAQSDDQIVARKTIGDQHIENA